MKSRKKQNRFISFPYEISEETGKTVSLGKIENGKMTFYDSHGNKMKLKQGVSTCYQGKKKKKTTNTVFTEDIYIDNSFALSEFEQALFIDTNTKKIGNMNVAIGVMILCDIKCFEEGFHTSPVFMSADCFPDPWNTNQESLPPEFRMKYENYMWSNFLSSMRDDKGAIFKKKSVLVVDSDLSNLPDYNNHQTKFFGGLIVPCSNPVVFLPEHFTMFYAKSDTPNDSILNAYIAACDYIANKIFKGIINRMQVQTSNVDISREEILEQFENEKNHIIDYFGESIKNRGLVKN